MFVAASYDADPKLDRSEIEDFIFRAARFNFDNEPDVVELEVDDEVFDDIMEEKDSIEKLCLWDLFSGGEGFGVGLVGMGKGQSGG